MIPRIINMNEGNVNEYEMKVAGIDTLCTVCTYYTVIIIQSR